jgi:hypothetical protein
MLTSFAPSPMANVIFPRLSFISLTTIAFYFGVTLQHTTLLHLLEMCMNFLTRSSSAIINANDSPSTSRDFFLL